MATKKPEPEVTKAEFDHDFFMATVNKQFGDEAITDLSTQAKFGAPGTYIPTSSDTLNHALGIGGIPRGRVIEIYGLESSGKSTLALDIVANAQRMFPNLPVFYGDAENALNPEHVKMMGVNISKGRFYLAQTGDVDEMLNLTYTAAKAGASLCVVDSIAALSSADEMKEENTTKSIVAGISKQIRSHLRKVVPILTETRCTVIYINHITYKPNVMYGSPETTPGGKGLPFFASVRLDVRKKENLMNMKTSEIYGIKSNVKVVKNKVAPPLKTALFDIIFGQGIDRVGGLIDASIEAEVVAKTGGWLTFDELKFNGRAAMRDALTAKPALEDSIRKALNQTKAA